MSQVFKANLEITFPKALSSSFQIVARSLLVNAPITELPCSDNRAGKEEQKANGRAHCSGSQQARMGLGMYSVSARYPYRAGKKEEAGSNGGYRTEVRYSKQQQRRGRRTESDSSRPTLGCGC